MSEYEYYEFQAIDRPLSQNDIAELRRYSTRARITPTSFVNDYSWGRFKGDENAWMEKYFDAFLYLSNWGSRVFKLRLPLRLIDVQLAREYVVADDEFTFWEKDGSVILSFHVGDDDGPGWVEGERQLGELISIRDELARGDLRALYLAWLSSVQFAGDDDSLEPPVPSGLADLSASLESFAEFLNLDENLIEVAARASAPLKESELGPAGIRAFVAELPVAEKDEILARMLIENDRAPFQELLSRMRERDRSPELNPSRRRCVSELLQAAEDLSPERSRTALNKAAREREERARQAAMAREKYLDGLVGKESTLWQKIQALIGTKAPKNYDEAVGLLRDLRDLDMRNGAGEFAARIEKLREDHMRKVSLIRRLGQAGL